MLFVDRGRLLYRCDINADDVKVDGPGITAMRPIHLSRTLSNLGQHAPRLSRASSSNAMLMKISNGAWVAEAALWLEWKYQGLLIAETHCCLCALEASMLYGALSEYKDALAMVLVYVRAFAKEFASSGVYTDVL